MIDLCNLPFHSLDNLRPAFHTIFNSKKCFAEMGKFICDGEEYSNILDYDTKEFPAGLSKAPFISNMGHIGFHTKSAYTIRRRDFRDYENDEDIFGYFSDLEDQRMNFLYFELCPPIKFKVYNSEKQLIAKGKVFVHIYPSGYLYLHIAASYLFCSHILSEADLEHIMKEFSPLVTNTGLTFHSKFGALSLPELCKELYKNLFLSLYTQQEIMNPPNPNWIASALVISDICETDLIDFFQLNHYSSTTEIFKRKFKLRDDWHSNITTDYIYCKKKMNFYFSNINRDAILHTFWKFLHLVEFVNYKKKIYEVYKNFFKNEALHIQNLRLNSEKLFYFENMFGKDFYESDILLHLLVLDKMVTTLGATERALYSFLSQNYGLDKSREHLLNHQTEWICQVEKWKGKQPIMVKLLKLLPTILK
jgi:hypothetical protein